MRDSIEEITAPGENVAEKAEHDVVDLEGYVLLPAPAEPHAHLDKAFTADRVDNLSRDLLGAIAAWHAYREDLAIADIVKRAQAVVRISLSHGVTAIRTHVDVGPGIEFRAVEALLRVREHVRDLVDLQLVALTYPLTGAEGVENQARLREALAMGADVAGGAPHVDPDPAGHVAACLAIAAAFERPVDLHADENLRETSEDLVHLAQQVASGFGPPATASHCVSLGMRDERAQAAIAAEVAAAGIFVITNPIANLYIQGRDRPVATPRGLPALRALREAGVTVAGGGDNVQDVFIPMGNADPIATAQYLVVGGQLEPAEAYDLVSVRAREVMGLPAAGIEPGGTGDLLAVRGSSLREVVATASEDRIVWRRGRIVARTELARWQEDTDRQREEVAAT
ncbi:MAG: amidohydrolase family protein [Gemmatimonadota bacterium]